MLFHTTCQTPLEPEESELGLVFHCSVCNRSVFEEDEMLVIDTIGYLSELIGI